MSVTGPRFQKKGPATVAAVPDHGSRKLGEQTMNEADASTAPPAMANRHPLFELENPTDDLLRLSSILNRLVEIAFDNPRRTREPDGMIMLPIWEDLIDDTKFVAQKLVKLSADIEDRLSTAINAQIRAERRSAA